MIDRNKRELSRMEQALLKQASVKAVREALSRRPVPIMVTICGEDLSDEDVGVIRDRIIYESGIDQTRYPILLMVKRDCPDKRILLDWDNSKNRPDVQKAAELIESVFRRVLSESKESMS